MRAVPYGAMVGEDYAGDDFYCDVAFRYQAQLQVVHTSAEVLAFHHTRPAWPVHIVAVPRRHIASLTTITAADTTDVQALLRVVQRVAAEVEQEHGAARVITNLGAYQDSKHLHIHIVSGSSVR